MVAAICALVLLVEDLLVSVGASGYCGAREAQSAHLHQVALLAADEGVYLVRDVASYCLSGEAVRSNERQGACSGLRMDSKLSLKELEVQTFALSALYNSVRLLFNLDLRNWWLLIQNVSSYLPLNIL